VALVIPAKIGEGWEALQVQVSALRAIGSTRLVANRSTGGNGRSGDPPKRCTVVLA
jgi:hypothetical protein